MPKRNMIFAAVAGSMITLGLVFTLGATIENKEETGRYQIVASNHHAFITDTVNGYAWTIQYGDDQYLDGNGDFFKAKR